jgi:hypothetical protein
MVFFLLLTGGFLLSCQNPYMVHNLARAVTATSIEFHTDKDATGDPPYSLKPIFSSHLTNYDVYVHEKAETVFVKAEPETGSSLEFGSGRYVLGGTEHIVPFENGSYRFPISIAQMEVTFTIYKDFRLDGRYKVQVIRRPDPGRLRELTISVAFYNDSDTTNKSNPAHPNWVYESDNYADYDSNASNFKWTIPYYTDKISLQPVVDQNIKIAYAVFRDNPEYNSEQVPDIKIDYNQSMSPQYIDFTGILPPGADPLPANNAHWYAQVPRPDPVSGQKTTYLSIYTILEEPIEDPVTGIITYEQRYPQEYRITLVWDKSKAYLKDLDVRDYMDNAALRLEGNFSMANTDYYAEVDAKADKIELAAVPRDAGSEISYEWRESLDGAVLDPQPAGIFGLVGGQKSGETQIPFPLEVKSRVCIITVINPVKFPPEEDYGRIRYFLTVRHAEPWDRLRNIVLEGRLTGGTWVKLFQFDDDNDELGPDNYNPAYATLKDPLTTPTGIPPGTGAYLSLDAEDLHGASDSAQNFTIEIDGVKIDRLRFRGIRYDGDGGTVTYNMEDNPLWPPQENEVAFNGGIGASITAKRTNYKDRVYAFTIMRAGAQLIELWTDMRVPPDNGSTLTAWPSLGTLPAEGRIINDNSRGTFQAIANNRPVQNALPGQRVTLRLVPKLGWDVDKLCIVTEDGFERNIFPDPAIGSYDSGGPLRPDINNPDLQEWTFTMPNETARILISYKFSAGKLSRVAYVAPDARANRSGPYGDNPDGNGTLTGTSWAYATCNLQGVINAFDGGAFDEIWLLEGTYRLDPPKDASDTDTWWAGTIGAGDRTGPMDGTFNTGQLNRSFVLKEGLRLYGGFKGKEGTATTAATQDNPAWKTARNMRFPAGQQTQAAQQQAARRTILTGALRNGRSVRHVVVAAGITSPSSDPNPGANRSNLSQNTGYDFEPFDDLPVIAPDNFDFRAGFNPAGTPGVTLLDTLTIRQGIRTADNTQITINSQSVDYRYGAGLYCAGGSPYLRNVIITDHTAVNGGGMYSAGASYPVLKRVIFENNDATGFGGEGGRGAGLSVAGGLTALLDCEFTNNATIGGNGAGMNVDGGGKALVRRTRFRYNNALGGAAITNSGETWIYGGADGSAGSDNDLIRNNSPDGISNGGTMYLVNLTMSNSLGSGGTLAGTNFHALGSVNNGGSMTLTNSTLDQGMGANGSATVLTNVVFRNDLGFFYGTASKTGSSTIRGCILTNVSFEGGAGINAGYTSSTYNDHHDALSLLMNSVRVNGPVNITQSVEFPDSRKGIYVTMNNVSALGGISLTNGNAWAAAGPPNQAAAAPYRAFNLADVRIRNSIITGGSAPPISSRRILGPLAAGAFDPPAGNASTLYLSPEKAALIATGDILRITNGSNADTDSFRNSVITLGTKPAITTPGQHFAIPVTATNGYDYDAGNYLALTSIGTLASGGTVSSGDTGLAGLALLQPLLFKGTIFTLQDTGGVMRDAVFIVTNEDPFTLKTFVQGASITTVAGDSVVVNDRIRLGKDTGVGLGSHIPAGNTPYPGNRKIWTLTGDQSGIFRGALTAVKAANGGSDTAVQFRLVSGTTVNALYDVDPALNTGIVNGTGNSLTFTPQAAGRAALYDGSDKIMLDNGEVQAGGTVWSADISGITWNLGSGLQTALLPIGTTFRIWKSGSTTYEQALCTVTNRMPENYNSGGTLGLGALTGNQVVFNVTGHSGGPYTPAAGDRILIESWGNNVYGSSAVPTSLATVSNANESGAITTAAQTWKLPESGQAGLFEIGGTFRIAQPVVPGVPSPNGTLRPNNTNPVICTVTGVDIGNNEITFTSSAASPYGPADTFVLLQETSAKKVFANFPGSVVWRNSVISGVNRAPKEDDSSWGGLALDGLNSSGAPRPAGDFLTGNNRPLGTGLAHLGNKGENSLYPTDVTTLVAQCFERYKFRWNLTVTQGVETGMTNALGNHLIWSGTPNAPNSLTKPLIDTFLAKDNGYNQGDLRSPIPNGDPNKDRKNGVIDIGAYEL